MTLALPLLSSLRARGTPAPFPKRFITMYTPNGQISDTWFPKTVTSETDFVLNEAHEPLAAHRDKLTLFKGLDLAIADEAGGGPGGPHQRGIGALFCGQHLQTGEFTDGCGSKAGWANGISIDQAIANHIGLDTPLKSIELGVRASDADVQARISYAGPGQPLPPMNNPAEVYERLFANFVATPIDPNDPTDQRASVIRTRRSLTRRPPSAGSPTSPRARARLRGAIRPRTP
jgi:hypothetical protein